MEGFDGTLAETRLDFDIHVRYGLCAVSAAMPVSVRLGSRVDFLKGAGRREQRAGKLKSTRSRRSKLL
jgi:hypothetical protein